MYIEKVHLVGVFVFNFSVVPGQCSRQVRVVGVDGFKCIFTADYFLVQRKLIMKFAL